MCSQTHKENYRGLVDSHMDFDCNYKMADALKFTGCLVALFKTIIFAKKIILLFVSQNGKIYKARGLIANCEGMREN